MNSHQFCQFSTTANGSKCFAFVLVQMLAIIDLFAHVSVAEAAFLLLCVPNPLGMKRCCNCNSPRLPKFSSFEMYTCCLFLNMQNNWEEREENAEFKLITRLSYK